MCCVSRRVFITPPHRVILTIKIGFFFFIIFRAGKTIYGAGGTDCSERTDKYFYAV